ncbi:DUF5779 family protein [Halorussus sp. MSC15.2]|uniref:DUF5779 family protein n=1 Tax=Halorussus sp. MSC15.2 TaxID=2283638 RepID=UPI0013D88820|nr:DUF5779 family protein [Halorussus sp. MSC15.2]NEU59034.1 hypothetical protein [Halorussus sp. MSC15.2]
MTSGFDLDLQTVEQEIEDGDEDREQGDRRIVLGELDGTTDEREWFEVIERGDVLVLAIEGDLPELAADLAPRVKERGGNLIHFREFLIVTPTDVSVDADRL